MSKTLVVVYSYTGTSRRLALLLCSLFGWPLGEIVDAAPRAGPTGTLRCAVDSLLSRQPAIRYAGPDPKLFDNVVLVSPIWAWRMASPMRSFVAARRADLKQVAVLSTMGSTGAPNAVAETASLLGREPVLAAAFTAREVQEGSCTARLQAFARVLERPGEDNATTRAAALSPHAA